MTTVKVDLLHTCMSMFKLPQYFAESTVSESASIAKESMASIGTSSGNGYYVSEKKSSINHRLTEEVKSNWGGGGGGGNSASKYNSSSRAS